MKETSQTKSHKCLHESRELRVVTVPLLINKKIYTILSFFFNHQRRRRLPPHFFSLNPQMSTTTHQSAAELLDLAGRLDRLVRAALSPGGDIRATMGRIAKNIVSHTTGIPDD